MCSKHGDKLFNLELNDVHYVPGQKFNLFSITKAMEQGWSLGGNSKSGLYVSKGDKKIVFDVRVPTKNGIILGGYMLRTETATANALVKKPTISLRAAHDRFGHINEAETRKIATAIGFDVGRGGMGVCVACTNAKAQQKSVPQESEHTPSTVPNERVFLDQAWITKPDKSVPMAATNVWRIIVDEATQLKFRLLHDEERNGRADVCSARQVAPSREAGQIHAAGQCRREQGSADSKRECGLEARNRVRIHGSRNAATESSGRNRLYDARKPRKGDDDPCERTD
jgi:hypothetical protein